MDDNTASNAAPTSDSETHTEPTLEAMVKFAAEYSRREVWSAVFGYANVVRQMIGNMPIRNRNNITLLQSEQDARDALQSIVDGCPERETDLARLLASPPCNLGNVRIHQHAQSVRLTTPAGPAGHDHQPRSTVAQTNDGRSVVPSLPLPPVVETIPKHVQFVTFVIDISKPFDLRRYVSNPVGHALLQYIETYGPHATAPLDYKTGVNHLYRHLGIGLVLHLRRRTSPEAIELLKDIKADERERLDTSESEARILRLVTLLSTETPSHSTLNAIRAVVILADEDAASDTRTAWLLRRSSPREYNAWKTKLRLLLPFTTSNTAGFNIAMKHDQLTDVLEAARRAATPAQKRGNAGHHTTREDRPRRPRSMPPPSPPPSPPTSPKRQAPSLAERAGLRFQTSNGVTSYDLDSDNLAALERMVEMLPAQQRQQVATYRQRQGHTLASLRQRVDISLDAHHDPSHTGHAHTLASWVGTKVQIVGLVTPAGMSINGLVGTVIGYQACPSEHMIVSIAELPHDACVKAANLQTPVSQRNESVATPRSNLAPNATTLRAQPPPDMRPPSPPPSPPEQEEPSDPNATQRELAEVKHDSRKRSRKETRRYSARQNGASP